MAQIQSTVMLLALEPDESLAVRIRAYKRRVETLIGEQPLVDQPPHMTMYLASFSSPNEVQQVAGRVAEGWTAPRVEIIGWHVFYDDPLSGNNTLVCDVAPAAADPLRELQCEMIDHLAPLRDVPACAKRLSRITPSLSEDQTRCARSFGYPYVGPGWHPHLTIAAIRPELWPRIEAELLPEPPNCQASCSTLKVFWLVDGQPCVLASFPLRRS